jgi:hypothetical protein
MVGADEPPLIEDLVLWPFRIVFGVAKSLQARAMRRALSSAPAPWVPRTELERTVYAALILAGQPVNNRRLATIMGVSPGEASRRVSQLDGLVSRTRKGREVRISLN